VLSCQINHDQVNECRIASIQASGRINENMALTAQSFHDMAFGGCGFGNQNTKSFCYVFQKPFAHGPLAIDESPDGPLIYTKTPRGCWNSAKHLDAMGEMIAQFL